MSIFWPENSERYRDWIRDRNTCLRISSKSTGAVKLSSATDAYRRPDLDDRPRFNIVIIYEDSVAGKRAKHFYDRVIRELVDECDFSLELWSFQVLAVPEIGNSAAKTAAQADFVILSMHRKAQLSVQIRDWIERWSGLITDSKSALVALLDQPGMKRGTVASTLDYLRKVAERKGLAFTPTLLLVSQQAREGSDYVFMDS